MTGVAEACHLAHSFPITCLRHIHHLQRTIRFPRHCLSSRRGTTCFSWRRRKDLLVLGLPPAITFFSKPTSPNKEILRQCNAIVSASLKFVRSKVEKLLLLTYEKITIYRIPNYLHSFPA